MRHIYTNRVVILISALLAGAAALWAWRQSRPGAALEHTPAPGATLTSADGAVLGREVYARACISCHAPDDPGHTAPSRLRAQTSALLAAEGGRTYVANLLLYGASGQRATETGTRRFRHPPFGELSDQEIANVLNVLPAEVPVPVFTADEIARLRGTPLSTEQVAAQRPAMP